VSSNQIINDFLFAQTSGVVTPPATGRFSVSGGKIFDPNGNLYVANGINLDIDEAAVAVANAAAQPLTTLFPGINHVRLVIHLATPFTGYPSPASMATIINRMTSNGIVVDIDDHSCNGGALETSSGAQNPPPWCVPPTSGSALTTVTNWYTALAQQFGTNPYVWFASVNEPCAESSSCSYASEPVLGIYQKAIYNAVRVAGGANNMMQMLQGIGGGNCQTVGTASSLNPADYANMTNIVWELHSYSSGNQATAAAQLQGSVSAACGYVAAQSIHSADGVVPVIFGEWGSGSGSANSTDASGMAAAMQALITSNTGIGQTGWAWFPSAQWQMVNNGTSPGGPFSLTTWGGEQATVIANLAPLSGGPGTGGGERLSVNTIASVAQNTAFTVTGTISGATGTPTLQYSDNGGSWLALPVGFSVTGTTFTFTHPGMAPNGTATVSVRDASNNSITATSAPFSVRAPESANNTVVVPTTSTTTPTFSDTFGSLSLHNTWQAGDKWQLIAPDTPAGRGGPNFGENGDQWWTNPFNAGTPISGIYTQDGAGLHLGLLGTPAPQQAYISGQAGTVLPYVAGLLNTSQTNYQKYGYWEIKVAVPKVNGFTFQADTENVQITGQFPPEIDLRIGTDNTGLQTVLFEFALGGGQYTKFVAPQTLDPTQMHTYGWDWESNFITFYIDNVQVFQAANPSVAYQSNPMFLFLVTAANYIGNTGDPALGSLPVNATVQAVNIYPNKPGSATGPSATIVDSVGNNFFITAGGQININGTIDGTTANVIELAYVNHVLWQENAAGNWYNYLGTPGSYGGPTTISPLGYSITVNTIGSQTAGTPFTVTGTINGASGVPTLQYEDGSSGWLAFPAGASIPGTTFSFTHPGESTTSSTTVSVRDAANTSVFGVSNAFAVGVGCSESPDQTVVTTALGNPFSTQFSADFGSGLVGGTIITDASCNTFAISSGAQILINGVADAATKNVIELAYVNHTLWQENASLNWYNYLGTVGSYGGPTTTSPLTARRGGHPMVLIFGANDNNPFLSSYVANYR
jgi:hypothetical protein